MEKAGDEHGIERPMILTDYEARERDIELATRDECGMLSSCRVCGTSSSCCLCGNEDYVDRIRCEL